MATAAQTSRSELVTITARVPSETAEALAQIAARSNGSIDDIARVALLRFVDQEDAPAFLPLHPDFEAFIAEGERSAGEQPTYSTEEVMAHFDQTIADARQ